MAFWCEIWHFQKYTWKSTKNIRATLIENPLSNRGISSEFSLENQILLTLEQGDRINK